MEPHVSQSGQGFHDAMTASAARPWPLGLLAAARLLLAGVLAAELLVVATLPFGQPGAAGLAFLLSLPLTLVAVVAARLTGEPFACLPTLRRVLAPLIGPPVLSVLVATSAVLVLGVYGANRFLTDHPLGPVTRVGYLATIAIALLVAFATRKSTRRPGVRRWFARLPRWLAPAVTLGSMGTVATLVDAVVIPLDNARLHLGCLAVAVAAFSGLAVILTLHGGEGRLTVLAGLGAVALVLPVIASQREVAVLAAQPPGTFYFQLVSLTRVLFDSDGDGYSRILGGGDCDDHDPHTHPLSTRGRDCLDWIREGEHDNVVPADAAVRARATPRIVVLVSIDAFRCGFGCFDRPELRHACPELTGLAREGRARFDVHTSGPNTEIAMAGLQLSDGLGGPSLGAVVRGAGYRSHAIATHRVLLRNPKIRASLDTVDDDLIPRAWQPNGSTASAVTDRALAWLRNLDRSPDTKGFLWAHHYDPHAPYAAKPGALFVIDRVSSYAAEVRRTDAELGRLAAGIRSLARAEEVLVMVTADHGEAFGEHGAWHHVSSMHEETIRVPFLVWAPSGVGRFVAGDLPAVLADVGPFTQAIIGGAPFAPSPEAFIYTTFRDDPQLALVRGGWKLIHHLRLGYQELYDLTVDPSESFDRAGLEPERVMALGRRIGANVLRRQRAGWGP